jgi:cytoskeleton protein RodZ
MVDTSAGKKLSAARLAKGLTIDEAAHATKMRPDKILALENDDYSRFGSAAYAQGFLLIYSRFLSVDVSAQLREFDALEHKVNVHEYQYLSNAPEPEEPSPMPMRRLEKRKPPSIIPLAIVVLLLAVAGSVYYVIVSMERLQMTSPPRSPLTEEATDAPAPRAEPAASPTPQPQRKPEVAESTGVGQIAAETGTPPRFEPAPAGAEIIPGVSPSAIPAVEQGGNINELIVEPLRKAWVKIRKDTPDSPPIFEGDLYPGVRPLKLRGNRFYVEVRDQTSVQIRKNGLPIAYQAPGISIQ